MLVSIMAVYNWDNTIFDGFRVPEGMDRDLQIRLILTRLAELSLLYSEPETIKYLIGDWTNTNFSVWEHLYNLEKLDYNPINNYDRTEDNTISRAGKKEGNNKTEDYSYGFNDENNRKHHDDTDFEYGENYNDGATEHKRARGNIGVTTTQQMIEQELQTRPKMNLYNYIVESFKHEFCIMVY